jgi:hypothetical protein
MKSPSKNVSASLHSQKEAGRSAIKPTVSGLKKGVSMTVPGEGGVEKPAGAGRGSQAGRSAAVYADAVSSKFGGKKST